MQIIEHSYQLCLQCQVDDLDVAVRSSATAEDLPSANFAGQQEFFLHIRGLSQLLTHLTHQEWHLD